MEIDLWALPHYPNGLKKIYKGKYWKTILGVIPVGLSLKKVKVSNTPGYDTAPGGHFNFSNVSNAYNGFVNGVPTILSAVLGVDLNEIDEETFCFIPAISAIDYDDVTDINKNISNNLLNVTNGTTDFKNYIGESQADADGFSNHLHENVSDRNARLMRFEMTGDGNFLPSTLTQDFNFGGAQRDGVNFLNTDHWRTTRRITKDITIDDAELSVNAIGRIAYPSNSSNPQNLSQQHLELAIFESNCEPGFSTEVIADIEGTFRIGDSPFNNTASVTVSSDASVEANSGGELIIESNSELIIEKNGECIIRSGGKLTLESNALMEIRKEGLITMEAGEIEIKNGAELRIHADALIDMNGGSIRITGSGKLTIDPQGVMEYTGGDIFLNGYDASFALGGSVKVSGNVEFKLASETGGPTGFLHIMDSNSFPEWHFESYGSNELLIVGNDKQEQLLLVDDNAEFRCKGAGADRFKKVRIRYGKLNLGVNARIQLDADYNEMKHVLQTGYGSRGVHLYDKGNFYYSDFQSTAGIKAIMTWSGARLYAYQCLFETGADVEVEEGSFSFSKCTFEGNNTYFQTEGISGPSNISSCTFNNVVIQNYSNGSVIRMTNSVLTNDANENGEIYTEGGQLELRCNTLSRYHIGLKSALLNMSIIDNAGFNVFSGTNGGYVYMDYPSSTLDMDYGYNTFYESAIPQFGIYTTQISPNPLNIDANHNYWQKYVPMFQSDIDEGPVSARFDGGWGVSTIPINVTDPYVDVLTACGTANPPKSLITGKGGSKGGSDNFSKTLVSDPIISTSFADTLPLSRMISFAADTMRFYNDSLGNDLVAIDMFSEIIQHDFDSLGTDVVPQLERAFQFMKTAVENAFVTDTLSIEDNESIFHPTVQQYVDVLMLRSDSVINDDNYVEQFLLEIDKAQLFNIIGRKEMCWALLDNLDNCPLDSTEQAYLNDWLAVIGQQLINIQVGMDNFDPDSLTMVIDTTFVYTGLPLGCG